MKKRQSGVLMHISSLLDNTESDHSDNQHMILLISSFGPSNVTGKSCRLVQLVMEILHTNLSQLLLGTLILLISIF